MGEGARPPSLGDICWAWLDPVSGREQGGRRPVVVVSGRGYLDVVDELAMVVPVTRVDRGWENHVAVEAGVVSGFAMTEQVRTLSRQRLQGIVGDVEDDVLREIRRWLADFLELGEPWPGLP